jgi:hypothetical protein
MLYTTARRVASTVRAGDAWLYANRDLRDAIAEMEASSLYGRGLPQFNADLEALYQEARNRTKGTAP